jgi:hypothetical protein
VGDETGLRVSTFLFRRPVSLHAQNSSTNLQTKSMAQNLTDKKQEKSIDRYIAKIDSNFVVHVYISTQPYHTFVFS